MSLSSVMTGFFVSKSNQIPCQTIDIYIPLIFYLRTKVHSILLFYSYLHKLPTIAIPGNWETGLMVVY